MSSPANTFLGKKYRSRIVQIHCKTHRPIDRRQKHQGPKCHHMIRCWLHQSFIHACLPVGFSRTGTAASSRVSGYSSLPAEGFGSSVITPFLVPSLLPRVQIGIIPVHILRFSALVGNQAQNPPGSCKDSCRRILHRLFSQPALGQNIFPISCCHAFSLSNHAYTSSP